VIGGNAGGDCSQADQPQQRFYGFDVLPTLLAANPRPLPTNNHEPFHWDLVVRVSPSVLSVYLNWHIGQTMPEGVWLAAEHFSRRATRPGPMYFAHKTQQGWQFAATNPEGFLLPSTDACALCHEGAPADHVFGLGKPDAADAATPWAGSAGATSDPRQFNQKHDDPVVLAAGSSNENGTVTNKKIEASQPAMTGQ
jgi:hypothetical protein